MMLGLLIGFMPVSAQHFSQQAKLPAIDSSRIYNVIVTPEITGASKSPTLSDIRIYDGETQIPYVLQQDEYDIDFSKKLINFDILENKQTPNGMSTLIFHNKQSLQLDHFDMLIKNTWVKKQISISGSDDRKKWYAVTENFWLELNGSGLDTGRNRFIKTVQIPLTDYKYYCLSINDSTTKPLNIFEIILYNPIPGENTYAPVPSPSLIKLKETAPKQSIFGLKFSGAYSINKIAFDIASPTLYHRSATLCTLGREGYIPLQQLTLASNQPTQIILNSAIKEKALYLIIENEDNPPLQITAIKAWQLNTYLITYLEKGKSYMLKTGDMLLDKPVYDFSYGKGYNNQMPPTLHAGKLFEIPTPEKPAVTTPTLFRSNIWIWAGIAGINILIGFLVFKLIKDMQKQKR
jgi:hypothetical protein